MRDFVEGLPESFEIDFRFLQGFCLPPQFDSSANPCGEQKNTGDEETDAKRREALYAEGFRKIAAEAYVVPLFRVVPEYAHVRGLAFDAGYLLGLPPLQGFSWQ